MDEVIGKVKCRVCDNEDTGFCKVKECKVKTNKARHCKAFIINENKIRVSIKPKSVVRPDWYWNRKEFIKELKKEEEKARQEQKVDFENPDVLSRFRSSASKNEEKKDG